MARRPGLTLKQRNYNRQQRALLRLRRAAVRYSLATDGEIDDLAVAEARTDLDAACDAFANTLTTREKRKMVR